MKLNKRQTKILELIRKAEKVGNDEIVKHLNNVSRVTVVRDLNFLINQGLIEKSGAGRGVFYKEKISQDFLKYIDIDQYFEKQVDQRKLAHETFNFDIFKKLQNNIFNSKELKELGKLNSIYRNKIKNLSKDLLKKEFERLTIELSWKSSRIEGNTYSLIDTEILIKENKQAAGHKKGEAIMILNHKKAIDYILNQSSNFKKLNIANIRNLHEILTADLDIERGLRKKPVGIVGTRYKPVDNQHQIKEAMEKFISAINKAGSAFEKAILAIAIISYIQPFTDGNKRTARILGNALLLAGNICPLSYRSVDESEYKKSLIIFYEQNNLRLFKQLFVEQFQFSVENYF